MSTRLANSGFTPGKPFGKAHTSLAFRTPYTIFASKISREAHRCKIGTLHKFVRTNNETKLRKDMSN